MIDVQELLGRYPEYCETCSITNLHDGCFSFIRSTRYLPSIEKRDVVLIAPKSLQSDLGDWRCEFVDDVDYVFTMIHNHLNRDRKSKDHVIGNDCYIHPSAVLDAEGIHLCKAPNGDRLQCKHMGNVVLGNNVSIFANAVIERGVFDSTIIGDNVFIDCNAGVGHNSIIGTNSVIAFGAILGGSVSLGKNCMVGLGAVIRNGVKICDDVNIGMGSLVVRDICSPGVYKGSPATFYKSFDEKERFS